MRIALLTPGFSASEDDWCIPALLDLVRSLRAQRVAVEVFALRYPHRREPYSVAGATVHPAGGRQRRWLGRVLAWQRTLRALEGASRHRRFDLLHALWAHEPGFLACRAARRLGRPVLVSVLGGELEHIPDIDYGGQLTKLNRWLIASALRQADAVTVPRSGMLDALGRTAASRTDAAVAPLGVDLARFRADGPRAALPGSPCLLQVAALEPIKDQRCLIAAFATLARELPRAQLHVVGEGRLQGSLQHWIEAQGLARRVSLHGAVDHDILSTYYRAADLCVQSSRFESEGMVVLEAAACATPTVGTATGVLAEWTEAPTCEPGNPQALARLLARCCTAPSELPALGKSFQTRVTRDYSVARAARRFLELYREATTTTQPSAS